MLALLVFLLQACQLAPKDKANVEPSPNAETDMVDVVSQPTPISQIFEQIVDAMPLEEKIGQLVLTGFEGTSVDETLRKAVEEYYIGHVILFKENIESATQLKTLNTALLNLKTSHPLWIALDEEGGNVSRLPKEFLKLPTAAKLANQYTVDTVQDLAAHLGELLDEYGFAVDFAPVFDVNSNPNNPVIGSRAFSANREKVSQYAMAFANGLQQQNIVAVAKHFPGHGDTDTDSHKALPIINKTREQLWQTELVPFQHAINEGISMMMVGHLLVPAIDQKLVATQSSAVMKELLREEMGFQGVIITDDLTMDAIAVDPAVAAVNAIVAGADIALIGHGTDKAIEVAKALKQAVLDGRIMEQQINESVFRILMLKSEYVGDMNSELSIKVWNEQMRALLNQ